VFAVAEIAEAARQTRTAHTPDLKTKRKKKGFAQRKTKEREREQQTKRRNVWFFVCFSNKTE
jgi:hypothetical protein